MFFFLLFQWNFSIVKVEREYVDLFHVVSRLSVNPPQFNWKCHSVCEWCEQREEPTWILQQQLYLWYHVLPCQIRHVVQMYLLNPKVSSYSSAHHHKFVSILDGRIGVSASAGADEVLYGFSFCQLMKEQVAAAAQQNFFPSFNNNPPNSHYYFLCI